MDRTKGLFAALKGKTEAEQEALKEKYLENFRIDVFDFRFTIHTKSLFGDGIIFEYGTIFSTGQVFSLYLLFLDEEFVIPSSFKYHGTVYGRNMAIGITSGGFDQVRLPSVAGYDCGARLYFRERDSRFLIVIHQMARDKFYRVNRR